ncbi:ATP-binding protein [Qipengyuania sp. G39]|uniref:ATP-binding protein n=1 Tax=Qipengyuania profundimaris TaxID=3067652 RepID=A0ABT9HQN3_9SPHN|nr:ATP-binding protein [Qipengyuania sp. G39]MDP4575453.1 ATP-binding protein [Qipengyuania sp. G39]
MTDETKEIYGGPQKRFFVSMLTRDISLEDAILDLVDNSVDGVMRLKKNKDEWLLYKGHEVNLTLSEKTFLISDNCGGIPPDYVSDAFSLGRPSIDKDGDLPTIGMYGIGMKRAIFKMAHSASVVSNHSSEYNKVEYSAQWLRPENNNWEIPLTTKKSIKGRKGVEIRIDELKSEVSKSFSSERFINSIRSKISHHFGYIIQRGLNISVNGSPVPGTVLSLFVDKRAAPEGITAFDYSHELDGVRIRVVVGLFRPLATEDEVDGETNPHEGVEKAGINVVCNDRVILLSDRTLKTGWGDGGVPRFHPQFRAIAGLIDISSNDASKLPIATTKNDLDVGSDVYLIARQACVEGIKAFTNFTNKWKGMEHKTTDFFDGAKATEARKGIAFAHKHGRKVAKTDAVRFRPALPEPKSKDPRRRISFVRESSEIKKVASYLFDDEKTKPAEVGAECFDLKLLEAQKNGR